MKDEVSKAQLRLLRRALTLDEKTGEGVEVSRRLYVADLTEQEIEQANELDVLGLLEYVCPFLAGRCYWGITNMGRDVVEQAKGVVA